MGPEYCEWTSLSKDLRGQASVAALRILQIFTGFVPSQSTNVVGGPRFLESLTANPVTVTGRIELYKGQAEIMISSPAQIVKDKGPFIAKRHIIYYYGDSDSDIIAAVGGKAVPIRVQRSLTFYAKYKSHRGCRAIFRMGRPCRLNHWLANGMRSEGIDFEQRSNAFLKCSYPRKLHERADSLTARDLLSCGQK
jgi:hypothetical protein